MLFCWLWRNVQTSCHKHFVVVFRHQQTPPLTTSDKCHNLRDRGLAVLITPDRSQRWQHTTKPYIGPESRFLPTTPAFDAPVRGGGSRRNIVMPFGKLEWLGYRWWKSFEDMFIRFDRIHERDRHTDGQTDTAWRLRPRLRRRKRLRACTVYSYQRRTFWASFNLTRTMCTIFRFCEHLSEIFATVELLYFTMCCSDKRKVRWENNITRVLLQSHCRVQLWQSFEKWSTFAKIITKRRVTCFFLSHSVLLSLRRKSEDVTRWRCLSVRSFVCLFVCRQRVAYWWRATA